MISNLNFKMQKKELSKKRFSSAKKNELFEFDEDIEHSLDFDGKITLSKEKMDKFFIENSYLKDTINFNEFEKQNKNKKNNGSNLETNDKILNLLTSEVNNTYNSKYQNVEKNLKTILKRMENFSEQIYNIESEENFFIDRIKNDNELYEEENLKEILEYEKNKKQQDIEFFSFKKKMQLESKKKKIKKELKSKNNNKKGVFTRLMNNKEQNNPVKSYNDGEFKDLNINYDSNKRLFNDLKKSKSKNEQKKIIKENWENFEKNFSESISNLRNHDFTVRFKQRNFNLNIFLANFMPQKDKLLNIKKENQTENEDEEDLKIKKVVENMLDGNLLELWKDYKFDNLFI